MTQGQHLTAFYVDQCHEQGREEMVRMKGHVARRAKELLVEVAGDVSHVEAVIAEFVRRRGRTPLQLAEISVELVRNGSSDAAERPDARRRAQEWIEEHGWPTGASFVHGSHSGQLVHDVLGRDAVPSWYEGWPHRKPTFDEIAHAVAQREV